MKEITINLEEAKILVSIWLQNIWEFGDMGEKQKIDPIFKVNMDLRKKLEDFTGEKIKE